jgi:hypothetical protein
MGNTRFPGNILQPERRRAFGTHGFFRGIQNQGAGILGSPAETFFLL